MTLPAAGTFFTVYEAAKSVFGRYGAPLNLPQPIVHSAASATAEMASCLVLTPAEVIKQNAQMLQRSAGAANSSTSMLALKQLGGPGAGRKLLSGYTAMVARNLPFTAMQFPIFEYVRKQFWRNLAGEKHSLLETGVITGTSAGLAGSFAAVITTPMDVVKTRIMLRTGNEHDVNQSSHDRTGNGTEISIRRSQSGLAIARQVLKERGVVGLFRGSVLRAVWTAFGSGLYLGMYEVSKSWLSRGRVAENESFP